MCNTHLLYTIAFETAGTWHNLTIELTHEIGRRINMVTEDSKKTTIFVPVALVYDSP